MPNHDYTSPCAYFVTILAKNDVAPFSDVVDGTVRLTQIGEIVEQTWRWFAVQYSNVQLDEFCIMPDHFHGILTIVDPMTAGVRDAETEGTRKPLGGLIGAFKTESTKAVNVLRGTPAKRIWQRDFYDEIVGDAHDLERIRVYIRANPARAKSPVG